MEDHDQVDMEFDLEAGVLVRCARVLSGEEHVKRDLEVWKHVAISYLDVLDLRRVSLSFECFHAHQLNLDRLYLDLGLPQYEEAIEWLIKAAVNTCDLATEVEARQRFSFVLRVFRHRVRRNCKILRLVLSSKRGVKATTWDPAVKFRRRLDRFIAILSLQEDIYFVDD